MFTILEPVEASQVVRKSRFVAHAGPVSDEQEARAFIAAHSDPSANHNCWAFRVGQIVRFNDDGEPSGTAGRPILAVIEGLELDGVAVVVTRHFGGILLGGGGLVRAYGGTASECLRRAILVPIIKRSAMRFHCPFADLAGVMARIRSFDQVLLVAEEFDATGAMITLGVPDSNYDTLRTHLTDLSSGRIRLINDGDTA